MLASLSHGRGEEFKRRRGRWRLAALGGACRCRGALRHGLAPLARKTVPSGPLMAGPLIDRDAARWYEELLSEIQGIPAVDTHEHLPEESERVKMDLDFFSLFDHYCTTDMLTAGCSQEDLAFFRDRTVPLKPRWERFAPVFSVIRTTGYGQSVLITIREVLGFPDLSDDTYREVSEALAKANVPGHYDEILRAKCNLVACIQSGRLGERGPDYFFHCAPASETLALATPAGLTTASRKFDLAIETIKDIRECVARMVGRWRSLPEVVGIKCGSAYERSLEFSHVSDREAERMLSALLRSGEKGLPAGDRVILEDFLMRELVARATERGLPMVFHTGLQTGIGGRIRNADPLLLQGLFEDFPAARFDLLHGGMPWVRECAVLAKYFPGVRLNMAWMHIIDPAQAASALAEWLDMVPNTKIFGFGGDYQIVENVYGHLALARRTIARVLAEKVACRSYSLSEARMVARRLMLDNPREFYLGGKGRAAEP